MSQTLIVLPVAAQVLLTYFVLLVMVRARAHSQIERGQTMQDLALATSGDWSASAQKAANNYRNLFELPVLFYAVTAFSLVTHTVDAWMIGLAWLFVVSRAVHSVVHVTSNIVMWRGTIFVVGAATILVMWVLLVWRVAAAGF